MYMYMYMYVYMEVAMVVVVTDERERKNGYEHKMRRIELTKSFADVIALKGQLRAALRREASSQEAMW